VAIYRPGRDRPGHSAGAPFAAEAVSIREQAEKMPLARHELALRLGEAIHCWPWGGLQREWSMYKASKSYLAASVSALAFGILGLLAAIVAWSFTPESVAEASKINVELRKSLPP
jgi:hypothetical protein